MFLIEIQKFEGRERDSGLGTEQMGGSQFARTRDGIAKAAGVYGFRVITLLEEKQRCARM